VALATEIKVVVTDETDIQRALEGDWPDVPVFLQPVDNDPKVTKLCVQTILRHPHLRLSMQVHKLIGVS
jgi:organic radical activating enzyme